MIWLGVGGESQGSDFAELLLELLPTLAAVGADVHVAVDAGGYHDIVHVTAGGEPVHHRVGRLGQFGFVPRTAGVLGAADGAGYAGDGVAVAVPAAVEATFVLLAPFSPLLLQLFLFTAPLLSAAADRAGRAGRERLVHWPAGPTSAVCLHIGC